MLPVASQRPMIEALTVRRGPRKGERYANVRPEVKARLELLGRERALIYKTLVLTGLRKGELASLTVASLYLDTDLAYAQLKAGDEKNREGNAVPIRADLADDLRRWLDDKLTRLQGEALESDAPIPVRLPSGTPLFDVPDKLSKILNRDLKAAGIAKRDDRGRVLDVHALRHTFGTLLSKGGVSPRTAQAAMRHSKIDLTMNVYTDPRLMDVAGALDALPTLSLAAEQTNSVLATGTDDSGSRMVSNLVTPTVTPTPYKSGQIEASTGNLYKVVKALTGKTRLDVTSMPVNEKDPLTRVVSGSSVMGATGFEPVTPSVSSWCSSQLS